ncbi:GNAT family N-acetyltransferase [Hasllibacter sp. MH4015]|uniref:GNAT family N-acetyltransferase n=1 Tax=Hasllibacter sp. MH4015 TaxID=2854029 RepID=UPI001CD327A5|nr:GNAT family N-acyltransferase [Hasllibacter sp. MH4015]
MLSLRRGRYASRIAETEADFAAAQTLRARVFPTDAARKADPFDDHCIHVLVEDTQTGTLVCCFRLLHLFSGREIERSYSAQFYDLSALQTFNGPMVELGRFCVDPDTADADILRVAWGAMTAYVDGQGVEMLFGCSSFAGTEPSAYADAFAMLRDKHLAPDRWLPCVRAPKVFAFAKRLDMRADPKHAQAQMPPLLRTYLVMGGWVSDHAVIDREMGTLHVFTGLEIRAVPPGRARLLRAMAG